MGSFIGMAAMCGAGVRIKDVSVKNLGIIPDAFRRLGVKKHSLNIMNEDSQIVTSELKDLAVYIVKTLLDCICKCLDYFRMFFDIAYFYTERQDLIDNDLLQE